MSKAEKERQAAKAREYLLDALKPGDTVYCVINSVARSGMSRKIKFLAMGEQLEGKKVTRRYVRNISYLIAQACGYSYDRDNGALRVAGCGMDMGFAVVYDLAATLWPTSTAKPGADPKSTGGYALKHEWL